ncbi:MAG: acyl-CoA dehydrogenase [Alphaproteobacteria bacterium]|nr:acyl-CoA dehydrogenase [Alphaproteobacteria bacterium]
MDIRLTDSQRAYRETARQFTARELAPWAARIDREGVTPPSVLNVIRGCGFLGAALPQDKGGGGIDEVSYGILTEEVGRVCSSTRSLMTVHNMSAQAIARFGDHEQQERWLPDLCSGRKVVAFALSEPEVGSAADAIETKATSDGNAFRVSGTKKWITYGLIADLFVVFAKLEGAPIALVVDRDSEGLRIEPVTDIFGVRGSMLAQLHFDEVRVRKERQLGRVGMGIRFVANVALDHGRFSVAWGSTGIIQACLDACVAYSEQRRQAGRRLKDFQLIRRQLANMLVDHTASRALCYRSACLRQRRAPQATMETSLAKYHASMAAIRAATNAVHMHGANGCSGEYPVDRYLRDATVSGIVEGTHEIHQLALASYALRRPYLD